ncbi:MAG: hypothetical protein JXQ96_14055 [Cyclobacteriaceae bacterium]
MMAKTTQILFRTLSVLLMASLILGVLPTASGQKKGRTRMKAYYEKLPNADKKISLFLTQGSGKSIKGVADAEIELITYNLDEEVKLAQLTTDTLGAATLFVNSNFQFPKNEDGYHSIKATYSGNDSLRSSKRSVEFLDLNIDISFEVVDSVKEVTVSTYQIDSTGNKIPIEAVDVNIGVERLYSALFLDEVETEEDGVGIFEFPNDIPGDSIGNLNVLARIDDHDDFGTVTQVSNVKWGTKVDYSIKSNGRSLFGDEAPLWMIISVFIILAGAWFNFMLAIYKILKLRNIGQN